MRLLTKQNGEWYFRHELKVKIIPIQLHSVVEDWHTLRLCRFVITQDTERDKLSVIGYSTVGSSPTAMNLYASMAQFGRASACHVEGCGFKSRLTLQRSSWSEESAESYLKTRGYSIQTHTANYIHSISWVRVPFCKPK